MLTHRLGLLLKLLSWRVDTLLVALAGAIVWLLALAWAHPTPLQPLWAQLLLLLAALVLVPLGVDLVGSPVWDLHQMALFQAVRLAQLPAALLLGAAYLFDPGWLPLALAVPWVLVTALLAYLGLRRAWVQHRRGAVAELCVDLALVYIVVGSLWAASDRFGYRPLQFDPIIVLLTAIHFHYAGFALPLIAGRVLREEPPLGGGSGLLGRVAGWGVLAGVPLVAAGITLTHLGWGTWLECFSAWALALAALAVAWLQARLALRAGDVPPLVRALWLTSSLCLAGSMALAALYGSRFLLDVEWLSIDWMRALHGTANAVGFALGGLLAWRLRDARVPLAATRI